MTKQQQIQEAIKAIKGNEQKVQEPVVKETVIEAGSIVSKNGHKVNPGHKMAPKRNRLKGSQCPITQGLKLVLPDTLKNIFEVHKRPEGIVIREEKNDYIIKVWKLKTPEQRESKPQTSPVARAINLVVESMLDGLFVTSSTNSSILVEDRQFGMYEIQVIKKKERVSLEDVVEVVEAIKK